MPILGTLACTISSAGISAPAYSDIYASLQASAQLIFGSDIYIAPDSQDGQFLAIFAKAQADSNAATIAAYNAASTVTAQGVGLSNLVKLSYLRRLVATNSQVNVLITGVAGTTITAGQVGDASGNIWNLPSVVTIPGPGSITVTATAVNAGAIVAPAGTVTQIITPTAGWQLANNPAAATAGQPVETDAQLRLRQSNSQGLNAITPLPATVAAVEAITGVGIGNVVGYENDTNAVDSNGLPAHSIAIVVIGGNAVDIATAIMNKKTPGCFTYGTTSQFVTDSVGITHNISFFVPTNPNIQASVNIHALTGYTAATGVAIQAAIAAYINALAIGQSVLTTRLYLPAQLNGSAASSQFELMALTIGLVGGALSTSDVTVAFNAKAICSTVNVVINLV